MPHGAFYLLQEVDNDKKYLTKTCKLSVVDVLKWKRSQCSESLEWEGGDVNDLIREVTEGFPH